jgi:pantoate ligase/cytidylate kinase
LKEISNLFDQGERSAIKLIAAGKQVLSLDPAVRLDYLEIVEPATLDPVQELTSAALVAVAAFVGNTRLIDNVLLPEPRI